MPTLTEARSLLKSHFNHSDFRSGQADVIESLLNDHSSLAVFPTGGGKSLCYQLPALLFEGLTLVVSPLIALMKDQVDVLQQKNIPAARLDSSLSEEENKQLYRDLEKGKLKLLYIAPERLSNERFRDALADIKISLLAIDEAHCISEWGHNFRPDYLKLALLTQQISIPRILTLTATATPEVTADICDKFNITPDHHHQLTFHRSNLHLSVSPISQDDRNNLLLKKIQSKTSVEPTIIYTTLQQTAESVAALLQDNNIPARPYHAGLRPETRDEIQNEFMAGQTPVICATIAFGMGIDKADIRHIIHYNLPKSLENYTQEIGRAGRDGQAATCDLLACADDLLTLENFIYADTPSPHAIKAILYHLLDQVPGEHGEFDLSLYQLSSSYDVKYHVLATLLTYLETDGYLTATRSYYNSYTLKFTRSLDHTLNGHNPTRQKFLTALIESGTTKSIWTTIEPNQSANALNCQPKKITDTLQYLEDHGDIILKPTQTRQAYRLLKRPDDLPALITKLNQQFQTRESNELNRLQQIITYAEAPDCHYQKLLLHFGEKMEPCGHCQNCKSEKKARQELPANSTPEITTEDLELIQSLINEKHPSLKSPRQLARFLAGLSSPATRNVWYLPTGQRRKKRLTHHDSYALLEQHPFPNILALCESQVI